VCVYIYIYIFFLRTSLLYIGEYSFDIICTCAGGLTENDFILAAKINGLDPQHLLRRKAAT